ncbi:MAG: response regulator [Candidatus Omnitrophota bacterium]|jgi:DNA-binding response OmpR family regulator
MAAGKIMIIDDDKEFLDELRDTLEMSGYDMVAVNDPFLAPDIADRESPDVIVLDLKMPGKNGFQLADELRHMPSLMQVPVIAMTGCFKEEYAPLIKMCDIRKCLKKPFNPLDIITEIELVLDNKEDRL